MPVFGPRKEYWTLLVVDPGGNLQSLAVMHWGLHWSKSYVTGLFVCGMDPALSGVL